VKIDNRFARNRRVTRTARMGRDCRYSKRYSFSTRHLPRGLRPRGRKLILRVKVSFQGNSRLQPDLSPTRRVRVRR